MWLRRLTEPKWKANAHYVSGGSSPQKIVDIFRGDWASRLPIEGVESGTAELFDDERIAWGLGRLGGVPGWRVLELGPLGAGHTTMLDRAGAREIVAVEANTGAFLKCLVTQHLLGIASARFVLADFDTVLAEEQGRFDLVLAQGVLYHLKDPLLTLGHILRISDRVFIWSHFFDEQAMPGGDPRRAPFTGKVETRRSDGDSLRYHERSYSGGQSSSSFCGGSSSHSVWIEKGETIALFEKHGFRVETAFE